MIWGLSTIATRSIQNRKAKDKREDRIIGPNTEAPVFFCYIESTEQSKIMISIYIGSEH